MNFQFWDIMLILVVSAQATIIAYVHKPALKALMVAIPFPFTIAVLAVGQPVNNTNVVGLLLLLLFTNAVRVMYSRLKINIIIAIILSVVMYSGTGYFLCYLLPETELSFWIACTVVMVISITLFIKLPPQEEPGHRSSLPIWVKLPIIIFIVVMLVLLKRQLQGFVTVFPMVGTVAAYESRHSLYTICREIPVLMLSLLPMMIICHIFQSYIGIGFALTIAWGVFLPVLFLLKYLQKK